MITTCPACGGQVQYHPDDIGRTVACRQCGARLEVDSDGLRASVGGRRAAQASAVSAPPDVIPADAVPAVSGVSSRLADPRPAWMDVASYVFLFGLFIVLPSVFVPMIQRASQSRIEGKLIEGQIPTNQKRHALDALRRDKEDEANFKDRTERLADKHASISKRRDELNKKMATAPFAEMDRLQADMQKLNDEETNLFDEDRKLNDDRAKAHDAIEKDLRKDKDDLDKEEKKWLKDRDKLEDERQEAQASALKWSPFFTGVLMFGSIFLAVGAIGFLGPRQTVARRVVGAVTLGLLVLLLFNKLGGGRSLLSLASAGSSYDFSTPQSAVTSEWQMELDGDIEAAIAHRVQTEGPAIRDRLASFRVQKEAQENGFTVLFASYQEKGKEHREIYAMKPDAESGIWRRSFIYDETWSDGLRKEIEDWQRLPDDRTPIPQ
jgi:hypothetical protein